MCPDNEIEIMFAIEFLDNVRPKLHVEKTVRSDKAERSQKDECDMGALKGTAP